MCLLLLWNDLRINGIFGAGQCAVGTQKTAVTKPARTSTFSLCNRQCSWQENGNDTLLWLSASGSVNSFAMQLEFCYQRLLLGQQEPRKFRIRICIFLRPRCENLKTVPERGVSKKRQSEITEFQLNFKQRTPKERRILSWTWLAQPLRFFPGTANLLLKVLHFPRTCVEAFSKLLRTRLSLVSTNLGLTLRLASVGLW